MKRDFRMLLALGVLTLAGACATARVNVAQEARGTLPRFGRVAVMSFANGVGAGLPAAAPDNVAGAIVASIQKQYGQAFQAVSTTATNQQGELVICGSIAKYDPGSKALRFVLIGLSPGALQLDVSLVDAKNGAVLEQFSTSGEIIAGGVAGASMGIEDMIESAASKVAERVARYGGAS